MPTPRADVAQATVNPTRQTPEFQPVHVRVRVTPVERRVTIDTGAHTLPGELTSEDVLRFMPGEHQRTLRNSRWHGYGITSVIQQIRTIPLQVWADAIAQYILRNIADNRTEAETMLTTQFDGGILAVGNLIYRLNPVAVTRTNRALAVVRRRAMDAAATAAQGVREAAAAEAASVRTLARREREEAQRMLRDAGSFPPRWLWTEGWPTRIIDNKPSVGIYFTYKPERLEWKGRYLNPAPPATPTPEGQRVLKVWYCPPTTKSIPILMWQPFNLGDGTYTVQGAQVDVNCPYLPHNRHDQSCMSPGALPPALLRSSDVHNLTDAIARTLRTIDLASLLVRPRDWPTDVRTCLPPALSDFIYGDLQGAAPNRVTNFSRVPCNEETLISVEAEEAETWRARDLARNPG